MKMIGLGSTSTINATNGVATKDDVLIPLGHFFQNGADRYFREKEYADGRDKRRWNQ